MFTPPRCPYRHCPQHVRPDAKFFRRHGRYTAICRPHPIPRFKCKTCKRTFSRQTFRADFRDHRPHLNRRLLSLLTAGVGLRQSARVLGLTRRCTELKFRKLARHLRRLNLNLQVELPPGAVLQFDELESFEGKRNTRPLSVPILIERKSRFVIWAESASIRPHGRMSKQRILAIRRDERRHGPRRNNSARSVVRTLRRGAALISEGTLVTLESDEKLTYPLHARAAFDGRPLIHRRTNSELARLTWNPLFPINHTEAMLRDLLGRLRRQSWLASKKRRYLDLGLQVWIAYRNFVRNRFNFDDFTSAQMLGAVSRKMSFGDLVSWRQDWGRRSIHPLSRRCASVAEWLARWSYGAAACHTEASQFRQNPGTKSATTA